MSAAAPPTYLDWAASAPPQPPCAADYLPGNPSSAHGYGRSQRRALADARARLAARFGCPPEEIVATGGATEADHLVLYSPLASVRHDTRAGFAGGLVISAVEHPAVAEPARLLRGMGFPVRTARAGSDGMVDLDHLAECLDDRTRLVALIAVNNETGAIQPLAAAAAVVRDHARRTGRPIHLHTDAVQAFCRGLDAPLTVADSAAVSGHKLGAPVGVGALRLAADTPFEPLPRGGGQEGGRRPGTENVAGLIAFARQATAAAAAADRHLEHAHRLHEQLTSAAEELGLRLIPAQRGRQPHRYSPYITCLSAPGVPAEVLVRVLDDHGVYVSRGSACSSSGAQGPKVSPVLLAMGLPPPLARGAFRVSVGWSTTAADVARLLEVLARELPALRALAT